MAEEKVKTTLDIIEKLIVDGQKDVVDRLDRLENGQNDLKNGQNDLKRDMGVVKRDLSDVKKDVHDLRTFDIKTLDTRMNTVQYDIKEIDRKLEEHIKQPAH
jgi:septation ring formation regulator EzrA